MGLRVGHVYPFAYRHMAGGELLGTFGYDFTIEKGAFDLHALVPDLAATRFEPERIDWSYRTVGQGLAWLSNQVRSDERTDRRQRLANLFLDELAEALSSHVFVPLTRLGYYLPADRAGIMNFVPCDSGRCNPSGLPTC